MCPDDEWNDPDQCELGLHCLPKSYQSESLDTLQSDQGLHCLPKPACRKD